MLKVAVIGLGDVSKVHIPIIQENPDAELVAVCDINEALGSHIEGVNVYTDYHTLLEKEELDCVHICLPHHLHLPATKACVEKGVHVFQEKPLALNSAEGLELVQLEEAHPEVKICICFQNRYNETFETLQEMIASGKYGNVVGIKGLVTWFRPKSYYEAKPWRGKMSEAGGGVLINQSIHTLDLMHLIGGEINALKATISNLLDYDIEVEDTATAHFKFKNGATGLFYATNANFGNSSVELQVALEQAKFTIKDSILTRVNEAGEKERIVEDAKMPGTKFYYGASHRKLIHQFYDCILNDTCEYVHVKDALPSIQIIDAIRKSSKLNQEITLGV